jgi:hypothetical protein
MSRARGLVLQNSLARYLGQWWPSAESAGAGRPGTDISGTPGIVWENKTAREWKILEWVRQAEGHARRPGDVPVTVYWPMGVGDGRPNLALAIVPLPVMVRLLLEAGYAGDDAVFDGIIRRSGA